MTSTIQTTLSHLLTALIQSYLILLESNKLFCMCLFYSFFSQFVLCKRCLYTQACFDVARPASTHRLKGDGLKRVSMDILLYTFRYSEIRLTQAHTHTHTHTHHRHTHKPKQIYAHIYAQPCPHKHKYQTRSCIFFFRAQGKRTQTKQAKELNAHKKK